MTVNELVNTTPDPLPRGVLVTGSSGMLGTAVVDQLSESGIPVTGLNESELNITHAPHIEKLRKREFGDFDWIVNCAAHTAVDKAETDVTAAMLVNGSAPGTLAAVCKDNGWRLLHISTDFVFDGESGFPYLEDAMTNPLNVYGKSKLLGEQMALEQDHKSVVVRTAWLFGPDGPCFPRSILKAWKEGKPLRVVGDQVGSPTSTLELAIVIEAILRRSPAAGIYHAAGLDVMSWHGFAEIVLEVAAQIKCMDSPTTIEAIKTTDWPTAAVRPSYSALSSSKLAGLGIEPMKSTKEALTVFCQRLSDRGEL